MVSRMKLSLRFGCVVGIVLGLSAALPAAELPIITKARARLGVEPALDGLKSIHYVGTLTHPDPRDDTKVISAKFEMIFQRPYQQRITATYDEFVETTALDGYDGWTRVESRKDTGQFKLTGLDADGVKRLRANTWETLSYFRGVEKFGGRIEDKGVVTQDGVTCQKVAFFHDAKIVFFRYFDLATGRLVFTETEAGATLRESGEIVAGGIRFPKTVVTTTPAGSGKFRSVSLTYEKVTVNEVFPTKLFTYPSAKNQ
jgi:hypothetical protein